MKSKILKILAVISAIVFIMSGLSAVEAPIALIAYAVSGLYLFIFFIANYNDCEEVCDMEIIREAALEDCLDMYNIKGMYTIINDGYIHGFEYERDNREEVRKCS